MLGVHVSKVSTVLDSKKAAKTINEAIIRDTTAHDLDAVQIFTYGPRVMVPNKLNAEDIIECTTDLDLSVHSAYASTKIWDYTEFKTESAKKQLMNIKMQLTSCVKIKAWGLVLHINKVFPDEAAKTMRYLKPLARKSGVKIILEMVASKADPDQTYETPAKIDNLTTLIGANSPEWGWCVDTAHLWGAGVDVSTYDHMNNWLHALTYPKKILMFHLNGSYTTRGSGKDKHAIAFGPDDNIWCGIKPEKSGVYAIMKFAKTHNIPVICEINRGKQSDVTKSLTAIKKMLE